MTSTFRDLRQFAIETADPNFSLSVPEPAKQVIRELLAMVDAALEVHSASPFWSGDDPASMYGDDNEPREPDGYICLTCSDLHVEDDLANWELDQGGAGTVEWPCTTVRALTPQPDSGQIA